MDHYDKYELDDFLQDDFFISSVLQGTLEHDEFWQKWLLKYPEHRMKINEARDIVLAIQIQPLNNPLSALQIDQAVKKIQQLAFTSQVQESPVSIKFYRKSWFQIAASIVMVMGIGLLLLNYKEGKPGITTIQPSTEALISVMNHTTESKLVQMSDGSLAVLTPGSTLKYQSAFNSATRKVYLEGQAFFEVHKNPAKPFLVYTQNMVTRVLGTSFTVRAKQAEHEFKVIVNTGKVLVYQKSSQRNIPGKTNQVTLVPNEEVTFQRESVQFTKATLKVPLMLSKEVAKKEFTFHDAPLAEIIRKLNQAYGVHIEYDEARLGKEILNASLSDRPLDEKVNFICKAINARCEITDGHIRIVGGNVNP